ncbi:glycosyltransferase family 4 protein [archaeon]|jgi:glycosyltransferase involved in cell wall biosynthesis|nr:glycosyltransferase family 4 protein [archaeon]MBT3451370.1 glycosyltransferase family 4 protein [archaeon]MBT6869314.1 glycosyltransferase family 4 protein [archaeon]MBT7192477.1 glycosyltransferase family 4 protein [archaeon]MBT7380553.1 glycosyltransferase family 4 protein [archaeon]
MKIAMIIDSWKPFWAGGQIHVWELCQGLVKNHDCKIDLFVMNLKGNNGGQKETYFNDKLNIYYVGKVAEFNFLPRIKWCYDLIKFVKKKNKKEKYDIIHSHANLAGFPGKILNKKLGLPITYTVHGCGLEVIKEMYGNNIKSKILYFLENFLQTKIKYDLEITVDKSFLKYNNFNKKIEVIPNGVDIKKFDSIESNKSDKFKIIFVGRLHPQKGLTYLLDALELIKTELKNVEVHIIGGGELERILKEKTEKLGLSDIVRFRGKIYGDNLIKEYKSSNLFVLPSLYEGQPLTLLEAWGAKLPVLVTDVGGNKDFVIEEKNGYIVNPKDINGLAQTLLKAIKNLTLSQFGEEGYYLVKNNYTWDDMVEKTKSMYENILNKI